MGSKKVVIYGGGTMSHVRPHLAICAPAYGHTAYQLDELFRSHGWKTELRLTRMAGGRLETNEDVKNDLAKVIRDPKVGVVVMSAALCDFRASDINGQNTGKLYPRLSSDRPAVVRMEPSKKLIGEVRKDRKDIFLIGFKTTTGATPELQYKKGLRLLKSSSCNLVLANDITTRMNTIITPEMAAYEYQDRNAALEALVDMATLRSDLTFTRTRVEPTPSLLQLREAPNALRAVVEHCVHKGAYKPFRDVTVGHYGWRSEPRVLYSSRRKHNYTIPEHRDMVKVVFSRGGDVVAHGFKPSAGVRSQYEMLDDEYDCVVHFHCPMKPGATGIEVRPQFPYECGSHECGRNTRDGLQIVDDGIKAVMLEKHGPNIVFRSSVDPGRVIRFIDENFDLDATAGAPSAVEEHA